MVEGKTFTLLRVELRRILVASGLPEKEISGILSQLEKSHRHMSIIAFAALLEKAGLNNEHISNIFRRFGMDDITIHEVIDMIDSYKINAETGRLYEVRLDV